MACNAGPDIIEDGLVFCVDAANINSYPQSGTTWTDVVGKTSCTLTNYGANPTFNSANGGSVILDGTDDYITTNGVTKTADCTFSCWATWSGSQLRMLFNAGPANSGPDLFFYQGKISWNTWDGSSNAFANIPSSASDGNFHQYVLVNDSSSTAKLYYDGDLLGTATYRSAASTTTLLLGAGPGYIWQGKIANFMVHNKLLSEDEIRQNYEATVGRFT